MLRNNGSDQNSKKKKKKNNSDSERFQTEWGTEGVINRGVGVTASCGAAAAAEKKCQASRWGLRRNAYTLQMLLRARRRTNMSV